jgi:hypothetical protein
MAPRGDAGRARPRHSGRVKEPATEECDCEVVGRDALRLWVERLTADYAADVRWSAPRRGLSLRGRAAVADQLRAEWQAMASPRLCVLRDARGRAQRFHEFTIRFRLDAPGIDGLDFPVGAEVELERLRIVTCDDACRIVAETCIETWSWLPAPAAAGSAVR